jgi:hypothetical protein
VVELNTALAISGAGALLAICGTYDVDNRSALDFQGIGCRDKCCIRQDEANMKV